MKKIFAGLIVVLFTSFFLSCDQFPEPILMERFQNHQFPTTGYSSV